jgi:hypothetical protein
VLSLVCPRCANPFASAMQTDPATFDAIRLESMMECCSVCDHAARG